jgi:hypothetical protein
VLSRGSTWNLHRWRRRKRRRRSRTKKKKATPGDGDVVENERCGRVVTPCIVELMNVGVWIVGGRHGCQL